MPQLVPNPLCSCRAGETCASCLFCETRNTQRGRKALCEKVTQYLVLQPVYQLALARSMQAFFPDKVVYDDEREISTMLFEAVLFEDDSSGITPLFYFIQHAPLSPDEKRLYSAWLTHTHYEFLAVEKVVPGKEVHLAELAGANRYRVYESRGSTTIKEGSVVISRIVPFLDGWMFTTETVLSDPAIMRERLQQAHERQQREHGVAIPQFLFVRKHLEAHRRRMATA